MHRTKLAARVAAAFAALALVVPGAARAGIDDGLVASYTFDDATPRDVSGNGNDGVEAGAVAYVDGWRGKAAQFGGVSSPAYVTAAATPSLAFLDDYTFSLWFSIDSTFSMDGWAQLNDDGHHTLFAKMGDTSGLDLRTWRSPENGLLNILAFDGRCCGGGAALASDYVIGLNEWHHAAFTSGGGSVRLYLDGVQVGEMPTDAFFVNPQMPSMPLQLGADVGGWWYPLDGMLDEVRVYNRALSPAEVAVLANRDFVAPQIAIATPADGGAYLLNQLVLADWSATDAGDVASGVCSATGTVPAGAPIDTSTLGPHTFTVDAADCAGNPASAHATYAVQYAFGGFLPPLLNDGTTSVVRSGNNVTVKFQLGDAAGEWTAAREASLLASGGYLPGGGTQVAIATEGALTIVDLSKREVVWRARWPGIVDLVAADVDRDGKDELIVATRQSVALLRARR